MEDSMIDMPNLVFDEKIGNKRVRDGEEEINTGRLEKRPSGILGVNGGGDGGEEGVESGGGGDRGGRSGGIIDTLILNVFHKSEISRKEEEDGGEVKNDVLDIEVEVEDKGDDLGGGDGGRGEDGGGDGGGGIINAFFSNIFHRNGSADEGGGGYGGEGNDGDGDGNSGDGGEVEDLNAEKLEGKNDKIVDAKGGGEGGQKLMKPDDYSERIFFLNNN